MTIQLTLLRHGESTWNRADRFAGWADVDLTKIGEAEARTAGRLLAEAGLKFDTCFTSVLKRATRTCSLVLEVLGEPDVPVLCHWRLNERHYGTLEGETRSATRKRHGPEQILRWRWSWDARPPLVELDDPRFPGNDELYAQLDVAEIPRGESLKDCSDRLLPHWDSVIAPRLQRGETVLVVAHGSIIRALVKHLDGVADEDIPEIRIPTGEPLIYEFDRDLNVLGHRTLRPKPTRVGRWLRRQWARRAGSWPGGNIRKRPGKTGMKFLDERRLEEIGTREFQQQRPYPWINPEGLLRAEGFELLSKELPDVAHFEKPFGRPRAHGQKSHDRYNLEYEPDDPHVPRIWHEFIQELESATYRQFIQRLFGTRWFRLRYHWHYTPAACSVSPHCDSKSKLGSHIFYMNTQKDWDPAWGGETLVLDDGGRLSRRSAPEFTDFDNLIRSQTLGNRSFLFQRKEHSWHGVEEIRCPEGKMRKVFIVAIDLNTPRIRMKEFFGGRKSDY